MREPLPARGQPQLPAVGHAFGLLLRRPLSDGARPASFRRRVRTGDGSRPTGSSSTRSRRPPSSPGTRRPRAGSSTSSSPRSAEARVPAQGQGTMNNVVFGNDRFTYYETIAGGQGACPDATGLRGARRDVEHAEHAGRGARGARTRSRSSATRSELGSGGEGRHRRDGVVREMRARAEPAALLAQRRQLAARARTRAWTGSRAETS